MRVERGGLPEGGNEKPRRVAPAGVLEIGFHLPRERRFRPSRAGKASSRGDGGGWKPWVEGRFDGPAGTMAQVFFFGAGRTLSQRMCHMGVS